MAVAMGGVPVFLFAFANDHVDDRRYMRQLSREQVAIDRALRSTRDRGACEVEVCWNATIEHVLDRCQHYGGRLAVFHFGGHADGKTLLFEGLDGAPAPAAATPLAEFLGGLGSLRLVVLNGCSTQAQIDALRARGIVAVVATSTAVRDDVAAEFAARFYGALAASATISNAFDQASGATRAVFAQPGDADADAKGRLLRDLYVADPAPGAAQAEWPWSIVGTTGATLIGRRRSRASVVAAAVAIAATAGAAVAWERHRGGGHGSGSGSGENPEAGIVSPPPTMKTVQQAGFIAEVPVAWPTGFRDLAAAPGALADLVQARSGSAAIALRSMGVPGEGLTVVATDRVELTFRERTQDVGSGVLACELAAGAQPRVELLHIEQLGSKPIDPGSITIASPAGTSTWTWTRAAGRAEATARACLVRGDIAVTLDRWPASGTHIALPESLGEQQISVSIRDLMPTRPQTCKPSALRIVDAGFTCRNNERPESVAACYRDSSTDWHRTQPDDERCSMLDASDANLKAHRDDARRRKAWECESIYLCL